MNALQVRKTLPVSGIGRAIAFSERERLGGTHVERKSGYLVAFRIDDRQDNAFNKATIQAFSVIPNKLKKSFIVDNGKEFAAQKK